MFSEEGIERAEGLQVIEEGVIQLGQEPGRGLFDLS
jgi:hypothetical protein